MTDPTNHRERAGSIADEEAGVVKSAGSRPGYGTLHALLAIHDLMDERLPKPHPIDRTIAARNLEAFKHATSKPMREHGECCEPRERAPREDEDPDEALAKALCSAWLTDDCFNGSDINFHTLARAAREHIEAECKADLWDVLKAEQMRAEKLEAERADERDRHDATITERDALRERLDAFRADVELFVSDHRDWTVMRGLRDILARAAERAKGGQR